MPNYKDFDLDIQSKKSQTGTYIKTGRTSVEIIVESLCRCEPKPPPSGTCESQCYGSCALDLC